MNEPQPSAPASAPPPAAEPSRNPLVRLWGVVREMFRGVDAQAATAMVVGMVVLVFAHHQGETWFYRSHFMKFVGDGPGPLHEYIPTLYWHLASVFFYLLVPLAAAALTPGTRVRELGLGLGDWRFGLKATALVVVCFLPFVYGASRFPTFAGHYPLCGAANASLGYFLVFELSFAAYFIAWEFLFRGYLLFPFERSMGKMAVFAQTMPFVIIHFGKPQVETLGSIVAGVALGMLALRTRSIWYGALIHISAAFSMDLFSSTQKAAFWKELF